MSDKYLKLNKPWRKGDWLIWPGTSLSNIEYNDCNDTVEGICYRDTTIEECMERCPSDNCGAGLFVKYKNGKSMCIPVSTGSHPLLTPLYRLRSQSLYNIDPNLVEMSVFVNTKLFPFPPNLTNAVFFGDVLSLEDTGNDRVLDTSLPVTQGSFTSCILKKGAPSVLTLQPIFRSANSIVHDRPIVYGDKFILAVKGTAYVMHVESGGINPLIWKESLGVEGGSGTTFNLVPMDSKNFGEIVTYSDTFSIKYGNMGFVSVDKEGVLSLITSTRLVYPKEYTKYMNSDMSEHINQSSGVKYTEDSLNIFFKFKSLTNANYCDDDGICKSVSSQDIVPASSPGKWGKSLNPTILSSGTYKGKSVFNHSGCWGLCDAIKPGKGTGTTIRLTGDQHLPKFATSPPLPLWQRNKMNLKIFIVVIGIVVTILIIACVLIYKRTRKSV